MVQRCIMIFPKFQNNNLIEEIRKQHDPLYQLVDPHVTLVFPFHSDFSKDQLREHIVSALKDINTFYLKIYGVSGGSGGYLFLNVIEGKDELSEIHNRLYTGMLEQYKPDFLYNTDYIPHMTIGRIADKEELERLIEHYKTMNETFEELIKEISVEIIGDDEESIIEMTIEIN
ncbi:2'-5' RNA ligase family protein [Paenibacillus polygoni]|uniref:2'-5' RNA ligase family protein n=1 Tax=Paenibacillus polygoni TaxID=3050112 RepID=A0ABY8XCN5_9BACL|nr:2'-5' RNA ligase family protein [Paenibacillus polygoni]WIV21145.1 2'-5' RNA ligase family protein [Paenibacillus polygoni]